MHARKYKFVKVHLKKNKLRFLWKYDLTELHINISIASKSTSEKYKKYYFIVPYETCCMATTTKK